MKNLNINGVLLDTCDEDFEGCTSAEKFVAELNSTNDDITISIDSVGGSVFASRSMTFAISKWCSQHPDKSIMVEVGSLCASAAANFVVSLPKSCVVKAYNDSFFMFHSCNGEMAGTPDELRSTADQMDKINQTVIRALLARTTLDEATVRQAFTAGAELWLTGVEAKECGLVDEIIDGELEYADFSACKREVYNGVTQIVAKYEEKIMSKKKNITAEAEETKPEVIETAETTEETKECTAETTEETKEVTAEAEVAENPEATEAENQNEEATNPEANKQEEEIGSGEIEALKAENESLKAQIEQFKAEIEALKAKMTAGLKTPSTKAENKKSFVELVREIPKGLSANAYGKEFAKLKAEHKAEYDDYMQSHQVRSFN